MLLRTSSGTVEVRLSEIERIETIPVEQKLEETTSLQPRGVSSSEELLEAAALAQGLPPEFVRSVAKIESGLRQTAVSPKGALGLMQLMPTTAAELGVDPSQPKQNAEGGAKYLRQLLILYHYDSVKALAAYNAGPGSVRKAGGVPPISETIRYIQRILREYSKLEAVQEKIAQAGHPLAANRTTATN